MRHRRRGFDRIIGKTFDVGELQKLIELSLVADGAAQPRADVCAAGRACGVIWINHHVVRHFEIKIAQRSELLRSQLLGVTGP